ncbi:Glucose-methanol-choline oxidoreductase [Heterostelium album PN500]|uniref:Glucose-methanol-choline oxidoreductase n=1 Tax=Heterostelium pallidum (strain ATCC 26659 / Pp 5 / PN500) TaxID=670386 RepID=D3BB43_HETP5|nr:Glucose-methanol-choline oxidoreductase [Heterostelium album PN500]EFA81780.1 Glucose-methanol-choline oxidoreductase [Heterostelium album PN500]|eukprot:XP_020433897.1 Glucose-methanol-choline oxidoreductase [Heterostelium album PN500]
MFRLYLLLSLLFLISSLRADDDVYKHNDDDDEYDYIVLGAGTAGSIVANKLSENKRNSILLVEEGGFAQHPWIWDPKDWVQHFITDPEPVVSRVYMSTPEPGCNNRTMNQIRAKVTGGCNMNNGMIFVVGDKQLYNDWADQTGESEWGWDNVHSKHISEIRSKFYLRKLDDNRKLLPEIKRAVTRLGVPFIPDVYVGNLNGLTNRISMSKPDNITYQRRETSYSTYIDPVVANRKNLDVLVYHRAEKIEFNGNKAVSVRLRDVGTGKIRNVRINKELIISLGAYESPVLLQASGVGNPSKLKQAGIKPTIDSPYIGEGLYDHFYINFFAKPLLSTIKIAADDLNRHTVEDGFLYFGTKQNKTKHDFILGLDFKYLETGQVVFYCPVELVNAKSVGRVQVKSIDETGAAVHPLITNNYLTSPDDIQILKDGIKECRRIQDKLVQMGIVDGNKPESSNIGQDDASIEDYIRRTGVRDFHPYGTVKMGRKDDPTAPLDPHLKLKGTENIRVIDASVIPSINVNTNAPTMIIALQASKFILKDNK